MTQQELYDLAGQLSLKEVAYLVSSALEHADKAEFGWNIDAGEYIFEGVVKVRPKIFKEP